MLDSFPDVLILRFFTAKHAKDAKKSDILCALRDLRGSHPVDTSRNLDFKNTLTPSIRNCLRPGFDAVLDGAMPPVFEKAYANPPKII
jgi:hypothetical protein